MNTLEFHAFTFNGVDAQKFLQGQVTLNVEQLSEGQTRYTGICNLKGRLKFGLWLNKIDTEHFKIIVTADQSEAFASHIKKFAAFSKATLDNIGTVYPLIDGEHTQFSSTTTDITAWQHQAIESGQAWICAATSEKFQPQELRLHQRDGVHYDKGCYLGQEIVARLWFKAKPKHWLHLIQGQGATPDAATEITKDVEVVNSIAITDGYKALVVAKPDALAELLSVQILALPDALNGDVARPQA
ncbi:MULTISPECIES: folate-binding Fe/S cluster repair protein [unclassified Acinetobacter]|uniref:CAF17-like 4Fe-4S cluster assembly/insertion protein YgfZ n=1 Tax=unclassified Acinetobacter TaxID=196816 RepID=UPI00293418EC|nr:MULTISPECIES: folate-binding Fe/S cluster repair protein [unclassified Acinetobacter]WOE33026.1 folate-binding Fe/S cluster repair protein [Acinetobacter sp. SAAs470]WOE38504.1 folate-binding Fe/S cluster repair protein [Acinetobacter sp. SAAs474]